MKCLFLVDITVIISLVFDEGLNIFLFPTQIYGIIICLSYLISSCFFNLWYWHSVNEWYSDVSKYWRISVWQFAMHVGQTVSDSMLTEVTSSICVISQTVIGIADLEKTHFCLSSQGEYRLVANINPHFIDIQKCDPALLVCCLVQFKGLLSSKPLAEITGCLIWAVCGN